MQNLEFISNAKQVLFKNYIKTLYKQKLLACSGMPHGIETNSENIVIKGKVGTHMRYKCPLGCKDTKGTTM